MKTITFMKRAIRQIRKIKSRPVREKIYTEIQKLKNFPDCENVKRLANHQYPYRLRVDDYRVFFNEDLKIIFIEEVKKRNERTYH